MSHVDFKKLPCHRVESMGQGPWLWPKEHPCFYRLSGVVYKEGVVTTMFWSLCTIALQLCYEQLQIVLIKSTFLLWKVHNS